MRLDLDWGVSPAKAEELAARVRRLGIDPALIEEGFTAGGGKGGQKVNKSANCVQLSYPPLDLRVRCQRERSLQLNRFLALRELVDRIELAVCPGTSRRLDEIERIRRRKSRRKARSRAKLAILLLAAACAAPTFAQGPAPDDDEQSTAVSVEPAEGVEAAAPPPAQARAAREAPPSDEGMESAPPARARAASRRGKKKPPPAPGLVYGREMNGKKVSVRPGQVFVIQLAGDPAGGAAWVLSRLDGIALDPVGEVEFHPNKAKPGSPRTGGMFTAGFRALKAGESLIELEARRPGERVMPGMVFSLKVEVKKPPKAKGKGKAKPKGEGAEGEDEGSAGLRPLDGESSSEEPVGD